MINYYAQEAAQTAIDAGLGGAVPMAILSTLLSLAVVAVMVVFVIAGCYQELTNTSSDPMASNFAYFDTLVEVRKYEGGK